MCDMYRKTIEHPDYLPVEIRKHTDFEGGKGMGRIYRVVRTTSREMRSRQKSRFEFRQHQRLAAAYLTSRDGWRSDTAHRLLLERRDKAAVPGLKGILEAESPRPGSRTRLAASGSAGGRR